MLMRKGECPHFPAGMIRRHAILGVACMSRFGLAATLLALVLSGAATAAPLDAAWDTHVTNYIESYFAANPSAAVYAGRHEFDGRLPDFSAAGLGAEAARLEAARKATAAFDPAGLDAGPPDRARVPALGHRQEPVLASRGEVARAQSRLVLRRDRSRDLSQQGICAARDAHAGVHRLCQRPAPGDRADPREPAHAACGADHRLWRQGLRRLRGVLRGRRVQGLRIGEGREAAGGAGRRDRSALPAPRAHCPTGSRRSVRRPRRTTRWARSSSRACWPRRSR